MIIIRNCFQNSVPEGGSTDAEWASYKEFLSRKCGMDDLLQVCQDAYDRYAAAK